MIIYFALTKREQEEEHSSFLIVRLKFREALNIYITIRKLIYRVNTSLGFQMYKKAKGKLYIGHI